MHTSLLARTALAATLSSAALLGTAIPVFAAVPRPTTLSGRESKPMIVKGQTDTIYGFLYSGGKGVAKQTVALEGRSTAVGSIFKIQSRHKTGPKGGVFFSVKPSKTKQYELVYSGTATHAAAHSGVVTVLVK